MGCCAGKDARPTNVTPPQRSEGIPGTPTKPTYPLLVAKRSDPTLRDGGAGGAAAAEEAAAAAKTPPPRELKGEYCVMPSCTHRTVETSECEDPEASGNPPDPAPPATPGYVTPGPEVLTPTASGVDATSKASTHPPQPQQQASSPGSVAAEPALSTLRFFAAAAKGNSSAAPLSPPHPADAGSEGNPGFPNEPAEQPKQPPSQAHPNHELVADILATVTGNASAPSGGGASSSNDESQSSAATQPVKAAEGRRKGGVALVLGSCASPASSCHESLTGPACELFAASPIDCEGAATPPGPAKPHFSFGALLPPVHGGKPAAGPKPAASPPFRSLPTRSSPPQRALAPAAKAGTATTTTRYRGVDYTHGALLGQGRYGRVYKAEPPVGGPAALAVKVIAASDGGSGRGQAKSDGGSLDADNGAVRLAFERCRREVEALAELAHPNLVKYRACVVTCDAAESWNRKLHVLMDYAEGETLESVIAKSPGAKLSFHFLQRYTKQIFEGLAYLHSRGVVHRDVKGSNILVSSDRSTLKLADYGLSKAVEDQLAAAQSGSVWDSHIGSPMYLAPEIILRPEDSETPASDVWATACTVLEMHGTHPYPDFADGLQTSPFALIYHIGNTPLPPSGVPGLGVVPAPLRALLLSCFDRSPVTRPSAAALLGHAFFSESYAGPTRKPAGEGAAECEKEWVVSGGAGVGLRRQGSGACCGGVEASDPDLSSAAQQRSRLHFFDHPCFSATPTRGTTALDLDATTASTLSSASLSSFADSHNDEETDLDAFYYNSAECPQGCGLTRHEKTPLYAPVDLPFRSHASPY
ncbi:Mitogen-activated protein kinase kinase kinase NPK1 [Diplonema papillatum]|nr:Mitogen-activated protein kinase kinase kinase NPK1 [Diplonema papillatum]